MLPADRPIDGEDIGPLLLGRAWSRGSPLYGEFDDDRGFHYALRHGEWKLLADEQKGRLELYNLDINPFELQDRSGLEPGRLQSMVETLRSRSAEVAADPLRPFPGRQP